MYTNLTHVTQKCVSPPGGMTPVAFDFKGNSALQRKFDANLFLKILRRKNWRAAEAKHGVKNPKKQRLTDLTGDTGPINSTEFDLDIGDTDTLNNSNSNNMGDTDLHTNINNSNSNKMGDTDLHTNINNSNSITWGILTSTLMQTTVTGNYLKNLN
ncbi:unnamed protein product [Mytilus edulis]|uniref:Uncharacterized protein n=1 Tax=Mytilus edulis TaxID=6550 RepID=A0A8S3Q116_MYTED|nr:unnamed protein product [Mytilus edulis]